MAFHASREPESFAASISVLVNSTEAFFNCFYHEIVTA